MSVTSEQAIIDALCEAIRNNDLEKCKTYLHPSANINVNQYYSGLGGTWAPLHLATTLQLSTNIEIIKLLIFHEADISFPTKGSDLSVLDLTMRKWCYLNLDIAEFFLRHMIRTGKYELLDFDAVHRTDGLDLMSCAAKYWQIRPGFLELFKKVVENRTKQFDYIDKNPISESDESESSYVLWLSKLVELGMDINHTTRAGNYLSRCIKFEKKQSIKGLLDLGADPNFFGEGSDSPLMIACKNNDFEIIDMLIKAKADVNALSNGKTALFHAFSSNLFMQAKFLLENGANPNGMQGHKTTLLNMVLYQRRSLDWVNLLIKHKVNTQERLDISENYYPIQVAVSILNVEVVDLLCKNGADINARNTENETPLMVALRLGYYTGVNNELLSMVKFLVQQGADITLTANDGMNAIELIRLIIRKKANSQSSTEAKKIYLVLYHQHFINTMSSLPKCKEETQQLEFEKLLLPLAKQLARFPAVFDKNLKKIIFPIKGFCKKNQNTWLQEKMDFARYPYIDLSLVALKHFIIKQIKNYKSKGKTLTAEAIIEEIWNECDIKKSFDRKETQRKMQAQHNPELDYLLTLNGHWLNLLHKLVNIDQKLPYELDRVLKLKDDMLKKLRAALDLVNNGDYDFDSKNLQGKKRIALAEDLSSLETKINSEMKLLNEDVNTLLLNREKFIELYSDTKTRYQIEARLRNGDIEAAKVLMKPMHDIYFGVNKSALTVTPEETAASEKDKNQSNGIMKSNTTMMGFSSQLEKIKTRIHLLEDYHKNIIEKTEKVFRAKAARVRFETNRIDEEKKIAEERARKDEALKKDLEEMQQRQRKLDEEREKRQEAFEKQEKLRRARNEELKREREAAQKQKSLILLTHRFDCQKKYKKPNETELEYCDEPETEVDCKKQYDKPKLPTPLTLESQTQISFRLGVEEEVGLLKLFLEKDAIVCKTVKEYIVVRNAILITCARLMDYAKQVKGNFIFPIEFARQFRNQIFHAQNLLPECGNELPKHHALSEKLKIMAQNILSYYLLHRNDSIFVLNKNGDILKNLCSGPEDILCQIMTFKRQDPSVAGCKIELNTCEEHLSICNELFQQESMPERVLLLALKYTIARISTFDTYYKDHYSWDKEFDLYHKKFKWYKVEGDKIRHVETDFQSTKSGKCLDQKESQDFKLEVLQSEQVDPIKSLSLNASA